MPWRRWSVSRAALKAVIGQFVGRQSVLGAVILCALAVWFGASTDLRVNPRVAVTGLVMAAVGLTATIASTWIGSGRWDDLARFPLRRDELARATCLVADAVVLLEAVAPIVLFVLLTGGGGNGRSSGMGITATTAVEMVAVGLGASSLGLILWAGERAGLRWVAGGALAVGTLLWWLAPAASALLFLDEPVDFLDFTATEFLYRSINDAAASGRSILLSSHIAESFTRCTRRLYVLSAGRMTGPFSTPEDSDAVAALVS